MSHPGLTELNWLPPEMPYTSSTVCWATYALVLVWWKPLPIGDRYTTYICTYMCTSPFWPFTLYMCTSISLTIDHTYVCLFAYWYVQCFWSRLSWLEISVRTYVQYIIAWAELYLEIPLKRSKVKVWRNKRGQAYLNVNDVRLDKSTGWGGGQMSPCAALNAPQLRNGIIQGRTTGSTMIADIPCGNEEQLSSVPLIPYL